MKIEAYLRKKLKRVLQREKPTLAEAYNALETLKLYIENFNISHNETAFENLHKIDNAIIDQLLKKDKLTVEKKIINFLN